MKKIYHAFRKSFSPPPASGFVVDGAWTLSGTMPMYSSSLIISTDSIYSGHSNNSRPKGIINNIRRQFAAREQPEIVEIGSGSGLTLNTQSHCTITTSSS